MPSSNDDQDSALDKLKPVETINELVAYCYVLYLDNWMNIVKWF